MKIVPDKYNIRVYGLFINSDKQVLVSDEIRGGMKMTKFPGGGHHFGEGLEETVEREWMEELNIEVTAGKLFYINGFSQVSAFNNKEQLLSIYYEISPLSDIPIGLLKENPFEFESKKEGAQSFRFISLKKISKKDFTFPIDKKVAEILRENYS